jgi:SagB-type dehydrogenase family enzyme
MSEVDGTWGGWGSAAWSFHLETKAADYGGDRSAETPPPPPFKCFCSDAVVVHRLPGPGKLSDNTLGAALLARRSVRSFTDGPLTDGQLADVLFYTSGVVSEEERPEGGATLHKCAPSSGGCHPIEVYCIVARAAEIPVGAYHYCIRHHALAQISVDPRFGSVEFLDELLAGQPSVAHAPVLFVFSCVHERLAWRYPVPRSYRAVHVECGHYGQNLLLAAAGLGLGACVIGFYSDAAVESALMLDGQAEFVMYAAAVGHPLVVGACSDQRPDVRPASREQ